MILDRTGLFYKKTDPGILRTTSPGRLVRYLCDDQAFIKSGDAYAELEVMKMYLNLISPDTGKITHQKQPGIIRNVD